MRAGGWRNVEQFHRLASPLLGQERAATHFVVTLHQIFLLQLIQIVIDHAGRGDAGEVPDLPYRGQVPLGVLVCVQEFNNLPRAASV